MPTYRQKTSPAEGGQDDAAQLLHRPLCEVGGNGVQQAGEGHEEGGKEGSALVCVHQLHALTDFMQQGQAPLQSCRHKHVDAEVTHVMMS